MYITLYTKMAAPMFAGKVGASSRIFARLCSAAAKTAEEPVKKVKEPIRKRIGKICILFHLGTTKIIQCYVIIIKLFLF